MGQDHTKDRECDPLPEYGDVATTEIAQQTPSPRWRRRTSLEKTLRNRPDLLERVRLSDEDKEFLAQKTGTNI